MPRASLQSAFTGIILNAVGKCRVSTRCFVSVDRPRMDVPRDSGLGPGRDPLQDVIMQGGRQLLGSLGWRSAMRVSTAVR